MIHIMQRCSAGRINKSLKKIIKNINRVVCSSFKILNILKLRLPHIYSSTIIVSMTSTYLLRTSETYCFESSICRFKPPILRDESWKKPQNAKLKNDCFTTSGWCWHNHVLIWVETSRKAFTLQRVEIPACIWKECVLTTAYSTF